MLSYKTINQSKEELKILKGDSLKDLTRSNSELHEYEENYYILKEEIRAKLNQSYIENDYNDDNKQMLFLFQKKLNRVCRIYTELEFRNESVISFISELLYVLIFKNEILDIKISKTGKGDDEIVIVRESENWCKNIIIDEEGDIEYLYIDNIERKNSQSEIFYADQGIDVDKIGSKLEYGM